MEFNDAIRVKGRVINPLEDLVGLPPRLELSLDDLDKIRKESVDDEPSGYIFGLPYNWPTNIFEEANQNSRTLFSGEKIKGNHKVDFNMEMVGVKGSGTDHWMDDEAPAFVKDGEERKYPIKIYTRAEISSHRFWGGENEELAKLQYVNALTIRAIAKRHGIEPATYTPQKIIKPEEIPILRNGNLDVVSLEEYCRRGFEMVDKERFRELIVPKLDDAKNFAQLFYRGKLIRLRVPPSSYKRHGDDRVYTTGLLKDFYSEDEALKIIINFTERVARTVDLVHRYGGSFTEESSYKLNTSSRFLSSLQAGNVSLGGDICDLDTTSFAETEEHVRKNLQKVDIRSALYAITLFANLFEGISPIPREGLMYTLHYEKYPTKGLAKMAVRRWHEIMPVRDDIRLDSHFSVYFS